MSRINLEDPVIERPIIKTGLKMGITMLPNANANLDADMGPILYCTPSASRTFTLPVVTKDMRGLVLYFVNLAAFTLVVNNQAAGAVATVPATIGATGMIVCLGDSALGIGGWTGGL
jgi:hypothetical protein